MNSKQPFGEQTAPLSKAGDSISVSLHGRVTKNSAIAGRQITPLYQTIKIERCFLFLIIATLPLQSSIPLIAGFSLPFILLFASGFYLVLKKPWALTKTLKHPLFLSAFAFLAIGVFMEVAHRSSGYPEILRIGFMVLGAIIIASLCRDRKALLAGIYGQLLASLWLSSFLILTTYGTLNAAKADDFREASRIRYSVFEENALQENENQIAAFAAQGGVMAFGLVLTEKVFWRQLLFMGTGVICLIGTFLPMSRGGVMILALSCAAMMYKLGIMKPKVILAVALLGTATLLLVPDAVFSRFMVSSQTDPNQDLKGRERVYSAVLEHLPEYIVTGVGITNFYGHWGANSSFFDVERLGVTGAHNCYAQVALYWGLPGLLSLFLVLWHAYRCLPGHYLGETTRLCVLGMSTGVLFESLVRHQLYAKDFAIALGILVGANLWVWIKPQSPRRALSISHRYLSPRQSHPQLQGLQDLQPGKQAM